jgi:hypothetical protein
MEPVGLQVPVTGSNRIAELVTAGILPPARRTFPFGKVPATALSLAVGIEVVGEKVPETGSYISTVDQVVVPSVPPATRIRPSGRVAAMAAVRATLMLPVAE